MLPLGCRSSGFATRHPVGCRLACQESARLNIRIFNPQLSPEYKDSESSPLQGIGGRATTLSPLLSPKKRNLDFVLILYSDFYLISAQSASPFIWHIQNTFVSLQTIKNNPFGRICRSASRSGGFVIRPSEYQDF